MMSYYDCDENVKYVQVLAFRLSDLSDDTLQLVSNDGSSNTQYAKYIRDSLRYSIGSFICQKYVYGHMNLAAFFEEMISEGLKEFIVDLPIIPRDIIDEFGLDNAVTEADGVTKNN
jgi:hypothetical protein